MFRNRQITVNVDKKIKDQTSTPLTDSCEKKADTVLHILDKIGTKVFLGICIYVVLDTHRQVSVARANYKPID